MLADLFEYEIENKETDETPELEEARRVYLQTRDWSIVAVKETIEENEKDAEDYREKIRKAEAELQELKKKGNTSFDNTRC